MSFQIGDTIRPSDFTGFFWPFGGSAAPIGFLLCDGSAVSRTTYAGLFAVIGISYGAGNGTTTFNLPDGRGRSFIGAGTGSKVASFASRSGNILTVTGLTNAANNEFQTGQAVTYNTSGSVITGLTNATVYYLIRVSNTTFSLASSLANAQNGTAIALSSDGTGIQTFTLTLTARAVGDTGGEENHAMSALELLSHGHYPNVQGVSGSSGTHVLRTANTNGAAQADDLTTLTGGNSAMNVRDPFFTGNWVVKT